MPRASAHIKPHGTYCSQVQSPSPKRAEMRLLFRRRLCLLGALSSLAALAPAQPKRKAPQTPTTPGLPLPRGAAPKREKRRELPNNSNCDDLECGGWARSKLWRLWLRLLLRGGPDRRGRALAFRFALAALALGRLRLGLGFFGLGFGLCVTTRLWRPPPKNMGTIAERTRNGTATGPPASPKPKGRPGEAAFCLALFGLERRDAAGTRLAVGFRDPPRLCLLRARQAARGVEGLQEEAGGGEGARLAVGDARHLRTFTLLGRPPKPQREMNEHPTACCRCRRLNQSFRPWHLWQPFSDP